MLAEAIASLILTFVTMEGPTVSVVDDDIPDKLAEMEVVPSPIDVAMPLLLIVATAVFEELQRTEVVTSFKPVVA